MSPWRQMNNRKVKIMLVSKSTNDCWTADFRKSDYSPHYHIFSNPNAVKYDVNISFCEKNTWMLYYAGHPQKQLSECELVQQHADCDPSQESDMAVDS